MTFLLKWSSSFYVLTSRAWTARLARAVCFLAPDSSTNKASGGSHLLGDICCVSEDSNKEVRLDQSLKDRQIINSLSRDHAYYLLQECTKRQDLHSARGLHSLIIFNGLDPIPVLADHLIRLFTCCGSVVEASYAFNKVENPSHHTWNATFAAQTKLGNGERTLQLYARMLTSGLESNGCIYLTVLKACIAAAASVHGRLIHHHIIDTGFKADVVIGSTLIDMYAKCGHLEEADITLNSLPTRNVISWGAMIAGYAQHQEGALALDCYEKMLYDGIRPDKAIFSSILKACGSMAKTIEGRRIHEQVLHCGLQTNVDIGNRLVGMYANCGNLEEAREAFDKLPNQDVTTWGAIIIGYAQRGECLLALECFNEMQMQGLKPDVCIFSRVLKTCGTIAAIDQGRCIHEQMIQRGFVNDVVVGHTLIDMYAKCGHMEEAGKAFDDLQETDALSWGSMIAGSAHSSNALLALECFQCMQHEGIQPDKFIFVSMLRACCNAAAIEHGRTIHEQMIQCTLHSDLAIGCTLIDMYAKCGNIDEAQSTFDQLSNRDVASWGTLIAGYSHRGQGFHALKCFDNMLNEKIDPDKVIFLSILKACGSVGDVVQGKCIHEQVLYNELQSDLVLGNAVIDMYAKCGHMEEACRVFDKLAKVDMVSWGTIIAGYAQHGENCLALEYFDKLKDEAMKPDEYMFSSVLKACSSIGAIEYGRNIHEQVIQSEVQSNVVVGSSLVVMYAKCGSLEEACQMFENLQSRDVVCWSSMIAGYVESDEGLLALEFFGIMQDDCVKPDRITFLSILKACGSIGALENGKYIHKQIIDCDFIFDDVIGNALADMYAKCGDMMEANKVFDQFINHDILSWGAMVIGYAQFGDVKPAIRFLEDMEHNGIKPDNMAFTGILTACSHSGLMDEGHWYFRLMKHGHGLSPNRFHYSCMVALMGRIGYFKEATDLLQVSLKEDTSAWTMLLSACKLHHNWELGGQCFDELAKLDSNSSAEYLLMSSICATGDASSGSALQSKDTYYM